ncbi:hypothetical protein [Lysobacter gummosus]|uniref:hypothetical protein n=1 Tax=Lysobacter gummosus TaxID=262324 RepID=UPI00362EA10C
MTTLGIERSSTNCAKTPPHACPLPGTSRSSFGKKESASVSIVRAPDRDRGPGRPSFP